jgi:hypothetical protein
VVVPVLAMDAASVIAMNVWREVNITSTEENLHVAIATTAMIVMETAMEIVMMSNK